MTYKGVKQLSLHGLFIDVSKNIGKGEKRFITVKPWFDSSNSKKIVGSKILVLLPNKEFERIEVKLPLSVKEVEATGVENLDIIDFEDLEGKTYDIRGNRGVSYVATSFKIITGGDN